MKSRTMVAKTTALWLGDAACAPRQVPAAAQKQALAPVPVPALAPHGKRVVGRGRKQAMLRHMATCQQQ